MAKIIYSLKNNFDGLKIPGGIFFDLGSGVGKAVIAASLLHEYILFY